LRQKAAGFSGGKRGSSERWAYAAFLLQAANLDCGSFDPFSFQQDFLGAPEVDVSRCEIAQV
jgi:hypothetical protein